jgi:hypothetical protein
MFHNVSGHAKRHEFFLDSLESGNTQWQIKRVAARDWQEWLLACYTSPMQAATDIEAVGEGGNDSAVEGSTTLLSVQAATQPCQVSMTNHSYNASVDKSKWT